jgi:hypothetical protein
MPTRKTDSQKRGGTSRAKPRARADAHPGTRPAGTAASDPAPLPSPAPAASGAEARIRMSAPVAPAGPPSPGAAEAQTGSAPTPGSPPAPTTDETRAQLERVFSPEIAAMLVTAAFGVAAVATGEPDIWQASEEEIEPLAPAIGRQLARIPIVRAIGPDNTEAGIVVLGIGVMVTRRLNEHARKRQTEANAERAALEASGERTAEPTDLATARAARARGSAPAPAVATMEDGSPAEHTFGIRA